MQFNDLIDDMNPIGRANDFNNFLIDLNLKADLKGALIGGPVEL